MSRRPAISEMSSEHRCQYSTTITQIHCSFCYLINGCWNDNITFVNHTILLEIRSNPNFSIHALKAPLFEATLASHSGFRFMNVSCNEHGISADTTSTIVYRLTSGRLTKHPRFPEFCLVEEGKMVVGLLQ